MPGRRTVLGAGLFAASTGLLVTVSGCRLRIGSPAHHSSTGVVPVPDSTDHLALDRAAVQAGLLTALYAQAVLVRPDITTSLQPLAADHAAHLRALEALGAHGDAVAGLPSPSAGATSPTASPPDSATDRPTETTPSAAPAQLTAAAAISVLGQAERTAVDAAFADLPATGGQVARLLASIAACSSTHLTLLARLPGTPASASLPSTGPTAPTAPTAASR
jgi:hypothetical protein